MKENPERQENTQEIRVSGRVQGVGFRPFVWRLARDFAIAGHVANDGAGVVIRARASTGVLETFLRELIAQAPPLAVIRHIEVREAPAVEGAGFTITPSTRGEIATEIAPDFATCEACRAEILTPGARRYHYPFTNCTHCGPRLSIVERLPYDRPNTTMRAFALCEACDAEYHDPADRRFHAQPIACPDCGPRLVLENWRTGALAAGDALSSAQSVLLSGGILAIKALGGYQLACDATDEDAVARLRAGKHRDGKPFALMAPDIASIRRHAVVNPIEARVLASREAPIVLLRKREDHGVAEAVAPGLDTLGFMLPSNPVQILLFEGLGRPLVMTSGNLSGDPQITADTEARAALGAIADHALTHDREIANRIDDSVIAVVAAEPRLLRRARGFAPAAFPLPPGLGNPGPITAMGADLKASFCLLGRGRAVVSAHQGDLESAEALADFEKNLALHANLYDHVPETVAADMNEAYVSTRLALRVMPTVPRVMVQHHHAHFAAVLGENMHPAGVPALGIVLDGLGTGEDGTLWGAELLLGDYAQARRIGGLKPTPLPGGDAASREPWRNLYAALVQHLDGKAAVAAAPALKRRLSSKPLHVLDKMMSGSLNAPLSSSCGRLFDAVAAALELVFDRQQFEGEAAMRLEALCGGSAPGRGYPFALETLQGFAAIDPAPFWRAILADIANARDMAAMARDFHAGLMTALVDLVVRAAPDGDAALPVALTGGCFQNRILFEGLRERLTSRGYRVLLHKDLPPNDGGIAFGQALVAAARARPSDPGAAGDRAGK